MGFGGITTRRSMMVLGFEDSTATTTAAPPVFLVRRARAIGRKTPVLIIVPLAERLSTALPYSFRSDPFFFDDRGAGR